MFVNLKKLNRGSMVVRRVTCLSKAAMETMHLYEKVYFGGKNVLTRLLEFDIVTIARVEPSLF